MNQEREYSSYAEWYNEGPFAAYVRMSAMAGNMISVVEAVQPAGDLSDPPINDLVLIRMLSPDAPCSIDLGAGRFCVSQHHGDFILIAPNIGSDIQMYESHAVELFSLPANRCRELLADSENDSLDFGELHASPFRSDLLNAMCQRLVEAARMPEAASRLFVDSASSALLGELNQLGGLDRRRHQRPFVCDWRVRRTMEQMDAHLGDDISLTELAATACLSTARYSAVFRAATGASPHAWFLRRKIDRSLDLLANPAIQITEIALSLGFSSSQHFATTFRAHMGMTPTAWRRSRLA